MFLFKNVTKGGYFMTMKKSFVFFTILLIGARIKIEQVKMRIPYYNFMVLYKYRTEGGSCFSY